MTRRNDAILLVIAVVLAILFLPSLLGLAFDIVGVVIALLIWALAGAIAGNLMKTRNTSLLGHLLLGLIGGLVGSWLLGLLGLGGLRALPLWIGPLITGVIGGVVVIFVWRLIFGRR